MRTSKLKAEPSPRAIMPEMPMSEEDREAKRLVEWMLAPPPNPMPSEPQPEPQTSKTSLEIPPTNEPEKPKGEFDDIDSGYFTDPPAPEIPTVKARLYELTGGMALIHDELEEAIRADMSEEARTDLVKAILARMHEFREATAAKIDNCCCMIHECEADEEAFSKEAEFFEIKARRARQKKEFLKSYVAENIRFLKDRKIDTGRFRAKLTIRPGGKLVVTDEQLLPSPKKHPEFWRFIPAQWEVAKDELKKAMKEGFECEGAKLVDSESLSIK